MGTPFRLLKTGKVGKGAMSAKDQIAAILPAFKTTSREEIERAAAFVERGHRAAEKGKYDEAESCFYKLFAIHPELTIVWVDYALGKYWDGFEGKFLRAYMGDRPEELDEILAIHPRSSRALIWKGILLDDMHRQAEALECYKRAQAINPDSLNILWNIVRVQGQMYGNFTRALEVIDTLLRIKPRDLFTLETKANHLCAQRRYADAITIFGEALAIDPQNTTLLTDEGATFELLGSLGKVLECFESAISIDPNHFVALTNKGVVLQANGKYSDALKCYDRALQISPEYANAYYNKARLKAVEGEGKESLELLAEAVRLNPNCIERANIAPEFQSLRGNARFREIVRQI